MISREQLLLPPLDVARLQALEDDLTGRGREFITALLKLRRLAINEIDFDCTYDNIAAEAQILAAGRYRVRIGRRLSNAVLHFAHWSAPFLVNRLNLTTNLLEFEEFLFEYWMWFTFHHELNHVASGHLDFLHEHGLVRYAEIYSEDENSASLAVAGVEKRDAWWAIESEADSNATATSLGSLPMMKHCHLLKSKSTFDTISMHGMLVSLYFVMFDRLKSKNDVRHPPPAFRKAICQPSLNNLCDQMKLDRQLATDKMIFADFELISDVLQLQVDVRPYFEASNWMLKLDALLVKMDMRRFRKQ